MTTMGSSSPARVESSPIRLTQRSSTPPSSPVPSDDSPIFKTTQLIQPIAKPRQVPNAFSVLGKRKAPLEELNSNVRSQKKLSSRTISKTTTQMQLSLGQKVEIKCEECGMIYVASSVEDRKLHSKFHQSMQEGVDIGGKLGLRLPNYLVDHTGKALNNGVLSFIDLSSPKWMRAHARRVLDVMTTCLGAIEITDEDLWIRGEDYVLRPGHHQLWVYLKGEICVAAMLVRKDIRGARRVVELARTAKALPGESAVERLNRHRAEKIEQDNAPLQVSPQTENATLGIARIWSAPSGRRCGYATKMLDAMFRLHQRVNLAEAGTLEKILSKYEYSSETVTTCRTRATMPKIDQVAFSQPTSLGIKLARKWFGRRHGWLVYDE